MIQVFSNLEQFLGSPDSGPDDVVYNGAAFFPKPTRKLKQGAKQIFSDVGQSKISGKILFRNRLIIRSELCPLCVRTLFLKRHHVPLSLGVTL